jgi:hypothetical protein
MSTHVSKVFVPASVSMHHGASLPSELFASLKRAGRAVWREFEAIGNARAEPELARLAVRYAHEPELAQAFRDAMHRAAMHRDCQH